MKRFSVASYCLVVSLVLPIICIAQSTAFGDLRASVTGRVLVEGDTIAASQSRVELRLVAENWHATAFTDRDGDFRIEGVLEGTYLISASAPGCAPLEETLRINYGAPPLLLRLQRNNPGRADNAASSVSVHELGIPEKARKAFDKGNHLLAAKKLNASISQYRLAIKAFPDFYEAYYAIGLAEINQDHRAEAEAAFRKSIEISDRRYAPPLAGLSLVLSIQQRFADAESAARENLLLDDTDSTGHYALALALYFTGRLADAEKNVLETIRYRPKLPLAFLLLAKIHQRQGHPAAVVTDLDAYLQIAPDSPESANVKAARVEAQNALLHQITTSALANTNP